MALFLPELGPGEGRQTEIDDRGIEQVEFACKGELLFWRHQLAPIEQSGEQRLEECRRLFSVHSRKGCLGGLLHAQMVQPFALRLEIVGDLGCFNGTAIEPIEKVFSSSDDNCERNVNLVSDAACHFSKGGKA